MTEMRRVEREPERPVNDLFKETKFTLPSRGVPYEGAIPEGVISIRPPSVEEVEFFVSMTQDSYDEQLSLAIKALSPSLKMDPLDLTNGDRVYLHTWIRGQIHPDYYVDITCPNPKCRAQIPAFPYPLSKIAPVELIKEYKGPMEFELPVSKEKIAVRVDTARDSQMVAWLRSEKFGPLTASAAVVLIPAKSSQDAVRQKAAKVSKLPGPDILFLASAQKKLAHGLDFSSCPFTCPKCSAVSRIHLPFRSEFFIPTVSFDRLVGDAIDGGDVRKGRNPSGDGSGPVNGDPKVSLGSPKGR